MTFADLETPALLLDRDRFDANLARMNAAMRRHGVALRPHVKTVKTVELGKAMTAGWSGAITVSTLKEAETFLSGGITDILYAVGIAPNKLAHAARLTAAGAQLSLILDSVEAARMVAAHDTHFPVLIEIDSDDHRAGVHPDDDESLVTIGEALGTRLHGVMTHGGGSYDIAGADAITAHAARERAGVVTASATLRAAGMPCPVVSVGSTPTALFGESFDGVTEVRAGVYATMDLVMAGLGVCAVDDIALSVLASVIGHQNARNRIIVDAGWMAMSRDRGTQRQATDQGYGLVCDSAGRPIDGLIVASANQEHGIIARRDGGGIDMAAFPVGTLLRILPNHACATATQHEAYRRVAGETVTDTLPRFGGW